MRSEDIGPTLEILTLDACRLATALAGAAEAEKLRKLSRHGPIALDARFVRGLIAARRLRSERLGPELAPEPGWSVLLALTVAHLEGWQHTQANLTDATGAPGATIVGRIAALEAAGLVECSPDPDRRRGKIVRLTDEAAARMHDYLKEAREI